MPRLAGSGKFKGLVVETSGLPGVVYIRSGEREFVAVLGRGRWSVYQAEATRLLASFPTFAGVLAFCKIASAPELPVRGRRVSA